MKIKEGIFPTSGLKFPMSAMCVENTFHLREGVEYVIMGVENGMFSISLPNEGLVVAYPSRFGISGDQVKQYMSENDMNQDNLF